MYWLSRSTARDWASARAAWNLVVILSIRMGTPSRSSEWSIGGGRTPQFNVAGGWDDLFFEPNQGGLPSGPPVPPVGEIVLRSGVSTGIAAVDPRYAKPLEPAARESGEVGQVPAAHVPLECPFSLRVGTQQLLADFGADLEMGGTDARAEPCQERLRGQGERPHRRLDHPRGEAPPAGVSRCY